MKDLIRWLGTQLENDELIARAAPCGPWSMNGAGSVVDANGGRVIPSVGGAMDGRATRWPESPAVDHILSQDPARVLREIDAKRQLIAQGGPFCSSDCDDPESPPMDPETNWTVPLAHHFDCSAYRAAAVLALSYAARPGYKKEWRP